MINADHEAVKIEAVFSSKDKNLFKDLNCEFLGNWNVGITMRLYWIEFCGKKLKKKQELKNSCEQVIGCLLQLLKAIPKNCNLFSKLIVNKTWIQLKYKMRVKKINYSKNHCTERSIPILKKRNKKNDQQLVSKLK